MGSRLRSLKKRTGRLGDGKGLGGLGRLTDKTKAIRGNTHNIEAMEKAVMPIWHRSCSVMTRKNTLRECEETPIKKWFELTYYFKQTYLHMRVELTLSRFVGHGCQL